MRILIRSPLTYEIERGEDSFEIISALRRLGADVYLDPALVRPPIEFSVSSLLSNPYPDKVDLTLHFIDAKDVMNKDFVKVPSNVNVLWTSHDSTRAPNRLNLKNYDAVMASDEVTLNALRGLGASSVLAYGYDSDKWKYMPRDWDAYRFVFSMILTGNPRENPEIAIEEFYNFKKDYDEFADAELVIKTVPGDTLNLELMDHVPGLTIIKEHWSLRMMQRFMQTSHCLLSPDSGGIRNRSAVHFASTGGSVIATNWSFNKSWLMASYSYPLKYTLVSKNRKDSRDQTVDPDRTHLHELMLEVVQNRYDAARKGKLASGVLPPMLDWSRVIDGMFLTLNEVVPEKGAQLYAQYQNLHPLKNEGEPWMTA